jgi:hypothetical protein
MSKRTLSVLLIATFWFVAFERRAESATNHCELTQADYDVFAGLIKGLGKPEHPEESWHGKEMLILDTTATQPEKQADGLDVYAKSKATRSSDAFRDYITKVRDSCPVKAQFGDPQSYRIIAQKEMQDLFSPGGGNGWEEFYKKYPKSAGYWAFSRPGFNSQHDAAWLYVVHACGVLCGTGHLYLLSKEKDDQWTVKYRLMLWIS